MASPLVKGPYPCTCEMQDYYLAEQPEADRRVVSDHLRHLADEIDGGLIKQISLHIAKDARKDG